MDNDTRAHELALTRRWIDATKHQLAAGNERYARYFLTTAYRTMYDLGEPLPAAFYYPRLLHLHGILLAAAQARADAERNLETAERSFSHNNVVGIARTQRDHGLILIQHGENPTRGVDLLELALDKLGPLAESNSKAQLEVLATNSVIARTTVMDARRKRETLHMVDELVRGKHPPYEYVNLQALLPELSVRDRYPATVRLRALKLGMTVRAERDLLSPGGPHFGRPLIGLATSAMRLASTAIIP